MWVDKRWSDQPQGLVGLRDLSLQLSAHSGGHRYRGFRGALFEAVAGHYDWMRGVSQQV